MSKRSKLVGLVIGLAIAAAALAGFAVWSKNAEPEAQTEQGLYVDGKKVEDPGVMMTVDGVDIPFEWYYYFYMNTKAGYTYNDAGYFLSDPDGTRAATLLEETHKSVLDWVAWQQLATERNASLTEQELAEVEEQITSLKRSYGADFERYLLSSYFADEDMMRQFMQVSKLRSRVRSELIAEMTEDNRDEVLEQLVTVEHILISYDTVEVRAADGSLPGAEEHYEGDGHDHGEGEAETPLPEEESETPTQGEEEQEEQEETAEDEPMTEEEQKERAGEIAQAVADQIHASDDPAGTFETLRPLYDSDTGQPDEGYTFGEGTMVEPFYEAALALEPGEFSEPIETDYGYHIIYRKPLDMENVEENESSLIGTAVNNLLTENMDVRKDKMAVVYGPWYTSVNVENMR